MMKKIILSTLLFSAIVIAAPKHQSGVLEFCGNVPAGGIILWSGNIASIPEGWVLCDGSNGTPDLRDRFVVGASQDNEGNASTAVVPGRLYINGGVSIMRCLPEGRQWVIPDGIDAPGAFPLWDGSDDLFGDPVDGNAHFAESFLPPFYALAYIMKQ